MVAEVVADNTSNLLLREAAFKQLVRDVAEEVEDRFAARPTPLIEDAAVVGADPDARHETVQLEQVVEENRRLVVERRAGREAHEASHVDDLFRALHQEAAFAVAFDDERVRHAIVPHSPVRVADRALVGRWGKPHNS